MAKICTMKKIFLLIAFLASYTLYAQEASPGSKISIGFNFSPDYNYRTIKSTGKLPDPGFESWEDNQIGKLGYTTALTMFIKLSDRVELETGLQYSNKGYQTKTMNLVFEGEPTNPLVQTKAKFLYSYQYIGIPLKLNLFFGEGDVRFVSGIGVTTNFLLNVQNKGYYEYANGKKETTKSKSTDGFNKIDMSSMISLGIDYKLTNTIHLRAEPTFRYGIIKTKDSPNKENLWNAGVNLGISFGL